nr:C4-dicarboxylate ABC transporter [Alphaproteobacteria bacterium]
MRIIVSIFALTLGVSLAAPLQAQEFTLRLHSFGSPTSIDHIVHLDPWAANVEKDSGGRIKIEVYPAMQ